MREQSVYSHAAYAFTGGKTRCGSKPIAGRWKPLYKKGISVGLANIIEKDIIKA